MNAGGFRAALLIAAVAGALLCLLHPEPFPSDEDEEFQWRVVSAPAAVARSAIAREAVHPPLDYAVDRAFESVFPGSCRRRVPPTLWGFLAVVVFGALVGARVSRFAGAAGAALFAAALYRISEARRLRPYPLAVLLLLLSLLLLDAWLRRRGRLRLAGAFAAGIACLWTLYLAGAVLAVAGAAMAIEDRAAPDPARRRAASDLLRRWPVAAGAVLVSAAPLVSMVMGTLGRRPVAAAPPLSFGRWGRIVSYAAYSPNAGYGFPPRALFLLGLAAAALAMAAGAFIALRLPGARWLIAWAIGGLVLVEIVKRIHPHWDSFRYFQPALPALTALEAVSIDAVARRGRRALAGALLVLLLGLDVPSDVRYYRYGVWAFSSGRRARRAAVTSPEAPPAARADVPGSRSSRAAGTRSRPV